MNDHLSVVPPRDAPGSGGLESCEQGDGFLTGGGGDGWRCHRRGPPPRRRVRCGLLVRFREDGMSSAARTGAWISRRGPESVHLEEGEAAARERLAASLRGEHGVNGAVEFDEPVAERDQRAGLQEPLDELAPAEGDAGPGRGGFQRVGVAVEAEAARRPVRVSGDRESVHCLDGWSGWVLHAVRIGSENERELRPAVERTVAAFGDPVAILRDLGQSGAKAVAGSRRRGVPDLLCQYHFLAAVGHRLLDGSYALLLSQIARSKVRSRLRALLREARADQRLRPDLPALLLWILEAEGREHPGYPFCLPHRDFQRRCGQFPAERDRRLPRPRSRSERRLLRQAGEALGECERLDPQGRAASRLERGWTLFCELRDVLRLSDQELPGGPRLGCKPSPRTSSATTRTCASASPGGRGRRPHQQCHRAVLRGRQARPAPPGRPHASGA